MTTATITRTASGKEAALVRFYRQLAADAAARPDVFPGTVAELAARAGVGRTTLTLMLNGQRSGRQSWRFVLPLLSIPALFHLKQCSAWNNHVQDAFDRLCWLAANTVRLESDFGAVTLIPTPCFPSGRAAFIGESRVPISQWQTA